MSVIELETFPPEADVWNIMEAHIMERWLGDECKCESLHKYSVCSIEVTHRLIGCAGQFLSCFNSVKSNREFMEGGGFCSDCLELAADCWKLLPV